MTPRQHTALNAILCAPSIESAVNSGAAGVTAASIYRWIREDETFASEYRSAQLKLRDLLIESAVHVANGALEALYEVFSDRNTNDHARVNAAKAALDFVQPALRNAATIRGEVQIILPDNQRMYLNE